MRPSGSAAFLEQRRLRAISFLDAGMQPGEIAQRISVDRRSVRRWKADFLKWGLRAVRAKRVQIFIAQQKDWQSNFLPPYAPELNPAENVWSYLKTKSMVNDAALDLDALTKSTRYHSRTLQKHESLLRSFLKHTPLFLRFK